MSVRIEELRLRRAHLRTRMPFRYGVAVMTELPHVFLQATVLIDGRRSVGQSAENLPPRWFTKDTTQDPHEEIRQMLSVIDSACGIAASLPAADSVFDLWWQLDQRQQAAADLPPLLTGLGTSLVERAVVDAFCRQAAIPLAKALREGQLGLDVARVHPELAGVLPQDWLPQRPTPHLTIRHTVGLSDPLTPDDLQDQTGASSPDDGGNDGLPRTLSQAIEAYHLKLFKLKIQGRPREDLERIRRVESVLTRHAPDCRVTLDGNEQFNELALFREFWEEMTADPGLDGFRKRLVHVEQPFRRDQALEEPLVLDLKDWAERPPIIIDESDGEHTALPTALDSGYVGTSYKSCKGLFRGVSAAALAAVRGAVISAEDLAGVGPIALLQDTAVVAALGLDNAERNGHHYFRGLAMFPRPVGALMMEHHGDLYGQDSTGLVGLRIREGSVDLTSCNRAPYGCAPLVDVTFCPEIGRY